MESAVDSTCRAPGLFDPLQFRIPGGHTYKGICLEEIMPAGHVAEVEKLPFETDDVIVASYPKSGTTLTQELVYLVRHAGDVTKANKEFLHVRVPHLDVNYNNDPDRLQKCFYDLERPRTMKTHLTFSILENAVLKRSARVVYVMRNPKDTLVSFFHFYRLNENLGHFPGTWHDFFEMTLENSNALVCGNMFDHYLSWWRHKHLPNILILKYEDLIKERKREISRIADFCGVGGMSDETMDDIAKATSFATMKSNPKTNYSAFEAFKAEICPFMRKGTVGDWKNYFTVAQNERFEKAIHDKLDGTGLEFCYD